uniref:SCHIP-1 domain-containing protein n=1 Tax=Strongyloides papillosus TaxID=174720 RepID=A0A0N5BK30_STREA
MITKCYNNISPDNNNNNNEEKIVKSDDINATWINEQLSQDLVSLKNDTIVDCNINKNIESCKDTYEESNILDDNLIRSCESLHIANDIEESSISLSECSLQLSASSFEQTSLENLITLEENPNEDIYKDYQLKDDSKRISDNRKLVMEEIEKIECKLPELDFKKIEETLHNSAIEHDMTSRRLLGDQVRRRLALQYEELISGPSPPINTYPKKSNFGERLQAANKLQICYLNELHYENNESDNCTYNFYKTKSKSAPNIKSNNWSSSKSTINRPFLISNTSSQIFNKQTKHLYGVKENKKNDNKESTEILLKAKESAKLQFDFEKKAGRFISCKNLLAKKLARIDLSRKSNLELIKLHDELQEKVDNQNSILVKLLIEKDILHMQQDSIICDIDDLLYTKNTTKQISKLPNFMTFDEEFLEDTIEDKAINNDDKCPTAHNTPRTETGGIFNTLKISKSYPAGFFNIFGFFKK